MLAKLLISLSLVLSISSATSALAAKKTIALLDFGGKNAVKSRARILKFLKKSYKVRPGVKLIEACEDLGIPLKRGRNLARCAQKVGAVAVVGGTTAAGKLHLVVYSGQTGEPLQTGAVPWGSPPTSSQISEALRLLGAGLSRAPASVKPTPPTEPAAKKPAAAATGEPSSPKDTATAGKPAAVEQPVYDPTQIPTGVESIDQAADPESDGPMGDIDVLGELSGIGSSSGYDTDGSVEGQPEDEYIDQDRPKKHVFKRNRAGVEATAGFGVLKRSFSVSKPVGGRKPEYDSGFAVAVRFAAQARPLAFFYDDWAAGFFARVRGHLTLGLQSQATRQGEGQQESASLGTSITELVAEVGWEWLVMEDPEGPLVSFSLGYGMLDFGLEWPEDWVDKDDNNLPDVSYRFVPLVLGGAIPFAERFTGHLRADYRVVLSSGQIVDDAKWYGSAFVGGFGIGGGVSANFSGFVISAEYSYTHFFFSFSGDRVGRNNDLKRAAGGATDQYHTAMLGLGYSY